MHALILDDEPSIGRVICRLAEAAGFSAQAVTGASAFQSAYRRTVPDIVLLDLNLDGEDGLAQLHFLADERYSRAVVFMSGYDPRMLSYAERLGRDLGLAILGSVNKPFRADEVAALFKELASRQAPPSC